MVQLQVRTLNNGQQRIGCMQLIPIEDYLERYPPHVHISIKHTHIPPKLNQLLQKQANGTSNITVTLTTEEHALKWKKPTWLKVTPEWLNHISGIDEVAISLSPDYTI